MLEAYILIKPPNRLRLWLCLITNGGGTVSKNVRLPQFKKSAALNYFCRHCSCLWIWRSIKRLLPLQRTWPSVRSLFLMRTSSFATKYFDDVSSDCFIFDIEISLTKICFVLLLWNNMVSNHIKDTNLYCLDRRYTYFINKKWWQSNIKFRIWLSE